MRGAEEVALSTVLALPVWRVHRDRNGRIGDKELGFLQFAVQWIHDPDVILPEKKGGGFFSVFADKEEEVEDVEDEEEEGGGSAEKTEAEIQKEQEEMQVRAKFTPA